MLKKSTDLLLCLNFRIIYFLLVLGIFIKYNLFCLVLLYYASKNADQISENLYFVFNLVLFIQ